MSSDKVETTDLKLVKAVQHKRFEVAMFETKSGGYRILWAPNDEGDTVSSEIIADFSTASFMFDLKVQELEGN